MTATPTSLQARDDSVLDASLTSNASTIYISAFKKWVNGVYISTGFDTTAGFCIIIDSTGRYEYIYFASKAVDSTTYVTTLSSVVRGLSPQAASFTAGTGSTWDAGTRIFVVDYPVLWNNLAKTDVNNTFATSQTFAAPLIISGTSSYAKLPELTTTQRNALTPTEGMMIKNSTTNLIEGYVGGAWVSLTGGTIANAANGVAGKVDIASGTEIGAGTAVDAITGAINVIPVSQTVKTSSGASDENKIPVLNSAGLLNSGFLPVGADYITFYGTGSDGNVTLSGDITLTKDMNYINLNLVTYVLNTAGYKISVRGLLTGTSGKIKAAPGGAGGNGGTGGAGGTAGAAAAGVTVPTGLAGKVGGAGGSVGNGEAGIAGTATTNAAFAITGAAGGKGGDSGTGQTGGASGAAASSTAYGSALVAQDIYYSAVLSPGSVINIAAGPSSGSGGGAGSNGTGGGSGGGSGANGGNLIVFAYLLTGAFTFESIGGAGGTGGTGGGAQSAGGGGGGGGGQGGSAFLGYKDKSGWSGSFVLTGGAKGAGGTTSGGGAIGDDGQNGTAGVATQVIF